MSIRIDGGTSFPEIETIQDVGNEFTIGGDTGNLDFGLLANQGKLNLRGSPGVGGGSGMMDMRSDDIELVDLDSSGPSINLNVRQPTPTISAPAVDEGIKILRDNSASSAFPKPAPLHQQLVVVLVGLQEEVLVVV
jgi:hypothetical protein